MVNNVLVALDNSELAKKVMAQAVRLAKACGADLTGISVVDQGVMTWIDESGVSVIPGLLDTVRESYKSQLARLGEMAEEEGIPFKKVVVTGNPAHSIVDYAGSNDIDLIVLGHVGRTGAERILLGSVAYKVANYAKCSVFIVR